MINVVVGSLVRSRGDVQRFSAVSDYSREGKRPRKGVRSASLKRMVCTNERRVSVRGVSCGMSKEKCARMLGMRQVKRTRQDGIHDWYRGLERKFEHLPRAVESKRVRNFGERKKIEINPSKK